MGKNLTAWGARCGSDTSHTPDPTSHAVSPSVRPDRIPDDIVHRELDKLRPLVDPALTLGAHLGESALDVGDLAGAQLVFEIEMLRNQCFDLAANGGAPCFRRDAVGSLLRARVRFEPKHLADELRAHAVTLAEFLYHVELHCQLCDLAPVLTKGLVRGVLWDPIDDQDRLIRRFRRRFQRIERADEIWRDPHEECARPRSG